jgi:hypothetical protein
MPNFYPVRKFRSAIAIVVFAILVAAYFSGDRIDAEGIDIASDAAADYKNVVVINPFPSPTPEAEHWHVAAYYDLENFPSAKFLLNNKDIVAREVRVTLYSLEGSSGSVNLRSMATGIAR